MYGLKISFTVQFLGVKGCKESKDFEASMGDCKHLSSSDEEVNSWSQ